VTAVQLDLFAWARDMAMAAALKHTERAHSLRGHARQTVEAVAGRFYTAVRYWSVWVRGAS
jgi:hypothetical protein